MPKFPYLQVALDAVKAAEEVLNKYYSDSVRYKLKPDQSPVTIADKKAEKVIRQTISHNFPEHNILGEEEGETHRKSSYSWVIDPIDGTKNYMRQIPLFATQLALLKDGKVILGVSNAPALGELMYAQKDKGCFLNDKRVFVSQISSLNEAYMSYGTIGYFNRIGTLESLLRLDSSTRGHRCFGDIWAYHLLAQGKIDIVLEAKVKIWDIAAASLLVEEAGGKVTDLAGKPIDEATTTIIATNAHLWESVADYFGK